LCREKLLNLPPASLSAESFACLKGFFESVNSLEGGLKKTAGLHHVENIDFIIGRGSVLICSSLLSVMSYFFHM
jgi:hypothetical protein